MTDEQIAAVIMAESVKAMAAIHGMVAENQLRASIDGGVVYGMEYFFEVEQGVESLLKEFNMDLASRTSGAGN